MADKKISELASASTPLAGTEVLPIVQSSTTVKVAVNSLTVQNIRSNATTGLLQIAGPAAGATRVLTVPDANATLARTDAAQSFTGDQTLSTGNLIIGTSGKGIDFSATPGTGTSELFNDYEEGTWTPNVGGDATYTVQEGYYVKIGKFVYVQGKIQIDVIGTGTTTYMVGLPFNAVVTPLSSNGTGAVSYFGTLATNVTNLVPFTLQATPRVYFGSTGGAVATSTGVTTVFQNGTRIDFSLCYQSAT